nr:movement protein [Piper chlorosis virus]
MADVLEKPKISDFLSLTKTEEFLPRNLTRLKTVSVSTRDIVCIKSLNELSDVKLLSGVPIDKYAYVGIVGVVASGEWLLPDNVRGGVTISFVDRRMTNSTEAILGTYRAAAKDKRFQFKLIPNYFVTSADAKRNPWQVHVKIQGVRVEEGWSPLTLEVVAVAMCANSIVSKGLREKIMNVGDPDVEKFEGVVDEFVDSVAAVNSLSSLRSKKRFVKKGNVKRNRHRPESYASLDSFDQSDDDAIYSDQSEPISVLRNGLGSSQAVD